ncbi:response regulator transcription factor [Clostridium thermarum]|uniref:response regulator transcription factor n=1 Tax=Clostridium thermarum TaxID=1716543 RepID=UPI0013D0118A|nr:response regulator transcription factor [Clostridium thermarum]
MKKILIIEDDISIAELERDYLEINGFEVEIQQRGDKGLQRVLEEDFNLVIIDIMLPGIDGFEICRQIRNNKNTPILMVSAKNEDIDKIRALGLGADDYVTKPFSPSELLARVKAHISRYERLVGGKDVKKGVMEIRGLTIDETSRRVYVNNKEVILTTKEFDLLLFLASNPNRVFTKEEIFERIWGMDSQGDVATVTVHIRKLREKVEENPSEPRFIETIWGVGYRFNIFQ